MADSTKRLYYRPSNHHFFKPLLPDFLTNFPIPKSFLKYLEGDDDNDIGEINEEKIAKLSDGSDKTWGVKIDNHENNGQHYFRDGWEKFCKDHELQVGDFLVFRHQGNFLFHVVVFDPSACEKECLLFDWLANAKSEKGLKKVQGYKAARSTTKNVFKPRGYPYFHTIVKSYSYKFGGMIIPKEFARKNGLEERTCDMVLINEEGQRWKLTLRQIKSKYGAVYIGCWKSFHKANALKRGDPVVFELIDSGDKPLMNFYKSN